MCVTVTLEPFPLQRRNLYHYIHEVYKDMFKDSDIPIAIGADELCIHELWALESYQFQRLEAGPGFYSILTYRREQ